MNARKILGSLALVGVVAASGSAFTAGNTMPAAEAVKGYGSQTISGVAAESISYNTDTAGENITSVGLVLTDDTTSKTIQIAFNDAAPATCTGGVYDGVTDLTTTYSCTITPNLAVGDATKFALVAI